MVVPHFYQSSEQTCGAACLRVLFAALGVAHDEATIAQHCGLTPLGCTVQDLVTGAKALGFNAALLPVSAEPAAITALSNETPFVARWFVPIFCRTPRGAVVAGDVELDAQGHIVFAPSREELLNRLGTAAGSVSITPQA